ncbi:MAG: citramalate synthase [Spirochaetales bacterium]|jgi:2-isopropylmalate synthase|nr:citramalate synthase [Spirochaetales bacterium]
MSKKIILYDTTLRDGMQGLGISFSLEDKISITHRLDKMKIDYIEGGFPYANAKETAYFNYFKERPLSFSRLSAFGYTRSPGGPPEDPQLQALAAAGTETVTLVGKAWLAHVIKVLGATADENLAMIRDSIAFLKDRGKEVIFDLEHFFEGYKEHREYSLEVLKTAREAGAGTLVLCDTNGGVLPSEASRILGELPAAFKPLGVHFHDDAGCAAANSLLSAEGGAVQIQGTINGWGERCGNANLCTIIPSLALKQGFELSLRENLGNLTSLSRFLYEKANIIPQKNQPYVGESAYSHKAGQHADVLLKAPELMEHLPGSLLGNHRRVLLSELAGKSTIVRKLVKFGAFQKDSPDVAKILMILKEKEGEGYEYETAEASFDILARKALGLYKPVFELDNYHLESYKTGTLKSKTVGRIFVRVKEKQLMGAGVGIGPVETLNTAINDALVPFFPFLKTTALTDYKVRVLNPEAAAAAKVRVFITTRGGGESWDTVGVSENIIEASWEALVDSIDYFANNFVF